MTPFNVFKTGPSRHHDTRELNTRFRHGFGVCLWNNINQIQENTSLQVYGNTKVLRFHFEGRENPAAPILLLWDDFSGHWTKEVTDYAVSINAVLMKIPPSATAVFQPADVACNQPFK
ncbi:Hypothetical protein PHPALM_20068 [Phytophthora palmivora]|uniref:DDE-1 domain-containing protein n=1 Tax=Phytophthora palmivora TaxID=4796 RepID=A0A2P4XFS4_9STRA|nr:Hypothetical protein PHPALM_20068 [Phytophthora palmivora]